MPSHCGLGASTTRGRGRPRKSKVEKVEPGIINAFVKHRKVKGVARPNVEPEDEELDPRSEWSIQEYGCPRTKSLPVPKLQERVGDRVVEMFLFAARWVYVSTKFAPFVKPSASLAARHTTCAYCNCMCVPQSYFNCEHCEYYPNSHAARCYADCGNRSGNLAFILRHLPGYEPAGPGIIEGVRAAFKNCPLEYNDKPGEKGYLFSGAELAALSTESGVKPETRLLEPNLVAMTSSGYEGYLMLLHDGGQLQGYGSTEECAALVSARRLAVYQEPEICSKRVPLPSAANGTVGRTLHYQTACLDGRANRCDFTLWDGKAPNMKPGCGPIPLLGGPKSIRITLASTHSSPPAETRDLMRRMVKDIREPCSHRPSCTTPGTPKGLSYHIIDRDEQDRPIRIFNSGWIWLDDADRKIVIDLYK